MQVHLMVTSVMCRSVTNKYGKSKPVVVVVKCVFFFDSIVVKGKGK